jgi:thiol-disulfide isomerase/thioredoxin
MDRLSALIAFAALGAACGKDDAPPPPSRVESAATGAKKTVAANTEAFCDTHKTDDSGPVLTFPPLAIGAAQPTAKGHWRWLNIWATYCKPCIEEMPRIVRWRSKLNAAGHPIDLAFVSIDENDADVTAFRAQHPDSPETQRLINPGTQTAWFTSLGLDSGAPIPVHVFVSPSGHVRCTRAGGIREQDYAAIESLVAE